MELPTIRFNIFRKLEYFEQLRKLNQQFDVQFDLRVQNEGGVYPTWEVEKKILYWTYANHKHLGSPLGFVDFMTAEEFLRYDLLKELGVAEVDPVTEWSQIRLRENNCFPAYENHNSKHRLAETFLSQNEILNTGHEEVFKNLVARGFAEEVEVEVRRSRCDSENLRPVEFTETKYRMTSQGLAFGELLWALYFPTQDQAYSRVFGSPPRRITREREDGLYKLGRGWREMFKWGGLRLQSMTSKIFYLFAAVLISSQVIEWMGLSTELKDFIKGLRIPGVKGMFLVLTLTPAVLFFFGVLIELLGGVAENKHKRIYNLLNQSEAVNY